MGFPKVLHLPMALAPPISSDSAAGFCRQACRFPTRPRARTVPTPWPSRARCRNATKPRLILYPQRQ